MELKLHEIIYFAYAIHQVMAVVRGTTLLPDDRSVVTWGSTENYSCFPPDFDKEAIDRDRCVVHWKHNDDNIVTSFRGFVEYHGDMMDRNNTELQPDMSLTIRRADWAWQGNLRCIYSSECAINGSTNMAPMVHGTLITIKEKPLRLKGCPNTGEECRVNLPQDAQEVNLTFIKDGARYDAEKCRPTLMSGIGLRWDSQPLVDRTRNADNSSFLLISFTARVENLDGSATFALILEDKSGAELEEVSVTLQKVPTAAAAAEQNALPTASAAGHRLTPTSLLVPSAAFFIGLIL